MQFSHSQDPRSLWDRFRRRELYLIATKEGVPFQHGAPATTVRQMLQDSGVDVSKYIPQGRPLGGGEDRISVDKKDLKYEAPQVESDIVEIEQKIEDVYLDQMSWKELIQWCKEHGVKKGQKDNKRSLLLKAQARLNGEDVT